MPVGATKIERSIATRRIADRIYVMDVMVNVGSETPGLAEQAWSESQSTVAKCTLDRATASVCDCNI
jgi:hypothetical protein